MNATIINAGISDSLAGIELIKKSDCVTCHRISEKLVAPAFKDIAAKYDLTIGNVERLSSKIINGGSGTWHKIPMTPHPGLSKEDAQTMVKYILLLKK